MAEKFKVIAPEQVAELEKEAKALKPLPVTPPGVPPPPEGMVAFAPPIVTQIPATTPTPLTVEESASRQERINVLVAVAEENAAESEDVFNEQQALQEATEQADREILSRRPEAIAERQRVAVVERQRVAEEEDIREQSIAEAAQVAAEEAARQPLVSPPPGLISSEEEIKDIIQNGLSPPGETREELSKLGLEPEEPAEPISAKVIEVTTPKPSETPEVFDELTGKVIEAQPLPTVWERTPEGGVREPTVTQIPEGAEPIEQDAVGNVTLYQVNGEKYYAPGSTPFEQGFRTEAEFLDAQQKGANLGGHIGQLIPDTTYVLLEGNVPVARYTPEGLAQRPKDLEWENVRVAVKTIAGEQLLTLEKHKELAQEYNQATTEQGKFEVLRKFAIVSQGAVSPTEAKASQLEAFASQQDVRALQNRFEGKTTADLARLAREPGGIEIIRKAQSLGVLTPEQLLDIQIASANIPIVERATKEFNEFLDNLPKLPNALQDAYNQGGLEAYNIAVKDYNAVLGKLDAFKKETKTLKTITLADDPLDILSGQMTPSKITEESIIEMPISELGIEIGSPEFKEKYATYLQPGDMTDAEYNQIKAYVLPTGFDNKGAFKNKVSSDIVNRFTLATSSKEFRDKVDSGEMVLLPYGSALPKDALEELPTTTQDILKEGGFAGLEAYEEQVKIDNLTEGIFKNTKDRFVLGTTGMGTGIKGFVLANAEGAFPDVKEGDVKERYIDNPEIMAGGMALAALLMDKPFNTKFTAEEAEIENKKNTEIRKGISDIYDEAQKARAEWIASNPEYQPVYPKGVLQSAKDNPLVLLDPLLYSETIAATMPYTLATMGAMAGGGLIGGAPGFALGSTIAFGITMSVEGHSIYEDAIDNGATKEQARDLMNTYGAMSAAVETGGDAIFLGVLKGVSKAVMPSLGKNVADGVIRGAAKKYGWKALTRDTVNNFVNQASQEAVQEVIHNAAIKTVNENRPLLQGTADAFVGGLVGTAPFVLLPAGGTAVKIAKGTPTAEEIAAGTAEIGLRDKLKVLETVLEETLFRSPNDTRLSLDSWGVREDIADAPTKTLKLEAKKKFLEILKTTTAQTELGEVLQGYSATVLILKQTQNYINEIGIAKTPVELELLNKLKDTEQELRQEIVRVKGNIQKTLSDYTKSLPESLLKDLGDPEAIESLPDTILRDIDSVTSQMMGRRDALAIFQDIEDIKTQINEVEKEMKGGISLTPLVAYGELIESLNTEISALNKEAKARYLATGEVVKTTKSGDLIMEVKSLQYRLIKAIEEARGIQEEQLTSKAKKATKVELPKIPRADIFAVDLYDAGYNIGLTEKGIKELPENVRKQKEQQAEILRNLPAEIRKLIESAESKVIWAEAIERMTEEQQAEILRNLPAEIRKLIESAESRVMMVEDFNRITEEQQAEIIRNIPAEIKNQVREAESKVMMVEAFNQTTEEQQAEILRNLPAEIRKLIESAENRVMMVEAFNQTTEEQQAEILRNLPAEVRKQIESAENKAILGESFNRKTEEQQAEIIRNIPAEIKNQVREAESKVIWAEAIERMTEEQQAEVLRKVAVEAKNLIKSAESRAILAESFDRMTEEQQAEAISRLPAEIKNQIEEVINTAILIESFERITEEQQAEILRNLPAEIRKLIESAESKVMMVEAFNRITEEQQAEAISRLPAEIKNQVREAESKVMMGEAFDQMTEEQQAEILRNLPAEIRNLIRGKAYGLQEVLDSYKTQISLGRQDALMGNPREENWVRILQEQIKTQKELQKAIDKKPVKIRATDLKSQIEEIVINKDIFDAVIEVMKPLEGRSDYDSVVIELKEALELLRTEGKVTESVFTEITEHIDAKEVIWKETRREIKPGITLDALKGLVDELLEEGKEAGKADSDIFTEIKQHLKGKVDDEVFTKIEDYLKKKPPVEEIKPTPTIIEPEITPERQAEIDRIQAIADRVEEKQRRKFELTPEDRQKLAEEKEAIEKRRQEAREEMLRTRPTIVTQIEADYRKGKSNPYFGNDVVIESIISGKRNLGMADTTLTAEQLVEISNAGLKVEEGAQSGFIYNPSKVTETDVQNFLNLFRSSFDNETVSEDIQTGIELGKALQYTNDDIATYLRNIAVNWKESGFEKPPWTLDDISKYAPEWKSAVGIEVAEEREEMQRVRPRPSPEGIPTMITRKMEADLKGRGFTQEQIDKMTPQEASEKLIKRTPVATALAERQTDAAKAREEARQEVLKQEARPESELRIETAIATAKTELTKAESTNSFMAKIKPNTELAALALSMPQVTFVEEFVTPTVTAVQAGLRTFEDALTQGATEIQLKQATDIAIKEATDIALQQIPELSTQAQVELETIIDTTIKAPPVVPDFPITPPTEKKTIIIIPPIIPPEEEVLPPEAKRKIKPGTFAYISGEPKGGNMWFVLPPPYKQKDRYSQRTTPFGAIDNGSNSPYDTAQFIGGKPTINADIDVGVFWLHIRKGDMKPHISFTRDEADAYKGKTDIQIDRQTDIPTQTEYQGREYTAIVKANTREELAGLLAEKTSNAIDMGLENVQVSEITPDSDGSGYQATITAHNFNPFKWVKEKVGKKTEKVEELIEERKEEQAEAFVEKEVEEAKEAKEDAVKEIKEAELTNDKVEIEEAEQAKEIAREQESEAMEASKALEAAKIEPIPEAESVSVTEIPVTVTETTLTATEKLDRITGDETKEEIEALIQTAASESAIEPEPEPEAVKAELREELIELGKQSDEYAANAEALKERVETSLLKKLLPIWDRMQRRKDAPREITLKEYRDITGKEYPVHLITGKTGKKYVSWDDALDNLTTSDELNGFDTPEEIYDALENLASEKQQLKDFKYFIKIAKVREKEIKRELRGKKDVIAIPEGERPIPFDRPREAGISGILPEGEREIEPAGRIEPEPARREEPVRPEPIKTEPVYPESDKPELESGKIDFINQAKADPTLLDEPIAKDILGDDFEAISKEIKGLKTEEPIVEPAQEEIVAQIEVTKFERKLQQARSQTEITEAEARLAEARLRLKKAKRKASPFAGLLKKPIVSEAISLEKEKQAGRIATIERQAELDKEARSEKLAAKTLNKQELPKYQSGDIKVYQVNGAYVRSREARDFASSGSNLTMPELIPVNEIWIEDTGNELENDRAILREYMEMRNLSNGMDEKDAESKAFKDASEYTNLMSIDHKLYMITQSLKPYRKPEQRMTKPKDIRPFYESPMYDEPPPSPKQKAIIRTDERLYRGYKILPPDIGGNI